MLIIDEASFSRCLWAFAGALLAGAILARPILSLLVALKSRQSIHQFLPDSHQKKEGTPTMGGILILSGLLAGALIVGQSWKLCVWILGFAALGFIDDFVVPRMMKGKRGLGWKQKIVAQIALAIAAAPVFGVPFELGPVALIAFLVLFFSNAYNFSDGLDGMAASLGLILCFGFAALAGPELAACGPILAALAGGFVPFLFLNAPPAKVFMGDVGSLPIGAIFGGVAGRLLIGTAHGPFLTQRLLDLIGPILVLSLVMIAELLPVPMQVGYYKLTKKRLFPMTPIHHSFEKKGWPESKVVWSFVLAQFVLCAASTAWVFSLSRLPQQRRYHYYYIDPKYYFDRGSLENSHQIDPNAEPSIFYAHGPREIRSAFSANDAVTVESSAADARGKRPASAREVSL